ncbi:hypothetical protein MAPG_04767 [Magnaporthiopsis poae ATCC 64411]|uniref:Xylanolytic transcriptional activator regulatory domain-containing protein n=1 Tax=Magnaporthiopsis poae (strain ATCC 64411 / 73-15) TaxID=644358 RepID=A0A0C4DXL3_MAGP6|nr:hypothetical protein MAPG_04767 [Magnaporthiopsis poae ATCC 64411]
MTYAATSEGLECLVLLAYCYMDSGMPRRAWYLWRKGLGIAQMMGLHQLSAASPPSHPHTRLWHAVYHGDLFASLVLGLPRGFHNPYHDDSNLALPPSSSGKARDDGGNAWLEHFIRKCTLLAGKVIDRNAFWLAGGGKQAGATYMEDPLSRALHELKELPPDGWWHAPARLPAGPGLALDSAVATLLLQVFYFHTAMYIHLPALAAADPASSAECAAAASNLLQRYLPLRRGPSPAFESITSDFVAFTAAVVLAIYESLSAATTTNSQHSAPAVASVQEDECGREDAMAGALAMFIRLEREAVGPEDGEEELHMNRLPGQCLKILQLLYGAGQPVQAQEIRIPYFGKVLLGPVAASGPSTAQQQRDGPRQPSSSTTAAPWREEADPTPPSSGPSESMLHAPPSTGPPADRHHQQGHDNFSSLFWGSDGGPITLMEFTPEFGGGQGHFDIFSAGDLPLPDLGRYDWGM